MYLRGNKQHLDWKLSICHFVPAELRNLAWEMRQTFSFCFLEENRGRVHLTDSQPSLSPFVCLCWCHHMLFLLGWVPVIHVMYLGTLPPLNTPPPKAQGRCRKAPGLLKKPPRGWFSRCVPSFPRGFVLGLAAFGDRSPSSRVEAFSNPAALWVVCRSPEGLSCRYTRTGDRPTAR